MSQRLHWPSVAFAAAFIGWCAANTDEIPIVMGFVLLLSAILGGMFPRKPWLTGFLVGIPMFIAETLVHFSVISAPYKSSIGLPWAALLGLVPAFGGAFFGSAIRHLRHQSPHAG